MLNIPIEKLKEAHRVLAALDYETRPVDRGYANRTLYINLSDNSIQSKPVSAEMKELFTGGRGFCLWLLWNATKEGTRWDDPANE